MKGPPERVRKILTAFYLRTELVLFAVTSHPADPAWPARVGIVARGPGRRLQIYGSSQASLIEAVFPLDALVNQ